MLRFTPTAWAKLQFFCHRGDTEIGGFGLTAADDLLCIEDFVTVKQKTSAVTVAFEDEAVADLLETQIDAGRRPEQVLRVWLHTHPGHSPEPSGVDEETFARVFGGCDWAVMFILAKGGKTYARLRFNIGPGGEMLIPVCVDYASAFDASDHAAWDAEYRANIHPERMECFGGATGDIDDGLGWCDGTDVIAPGWLDVDDPRVVLDDDELFARLRDMEEDEYEELFEQEDEVPI